MTLMEQKLIDIVKANLKARGISQSYIAERLGVTRASVNQMFTETIPLRRLNQFAEIAGCSVCELVALPDDTPKEISITINGKTNTYQLKQSTDEKD